MSFSAGAECRDAACACTGAWPRGFVGLTCSPCSTYWLALHHREDGYPFIICTEALAVRAGGSSASWSDVLGVDFYPLVKYCPQYWAGCSFKTSGGWNRGRPARGPALRQQSQKAATCFPFSVPLRKSFNSAFQQDDLTGNLAQHSFFFFVLPPKCLVINEIKELTTKLSPHPANKTVDMKHPPFRHSLHKHGELTWC